MPNATLLVADDDDDIRLALRMLLESKGYRVREAEDEKAVLKQLSIAPVDLILLDMNFSKDTTSGHEGLALLKQLQDQQLPIILMTAWATIELAVKGLTQGAVDFIEKPWNKIKLLNSIEQQLQTSQLKAQNTAYRRYLSSPAQSDDNWVCQSKVMQTIDQQINQIAPTDANVLILGENGTGKSLLATKIHERSNRQQAPLISVNMAAIPDNLFESELFGHIKGAFTDAKQTRTGRFELAESGSLFLDEIGSLPLHLQPKMLRVLETGEYEVLGSSDTKRCDVRIISATNVDLSQAVQDQRFRQDLLYRLNTFIIHLPPLRERLQDIKPLAQYFIRELAAKYHKNVNGLSDDAVAALQAYAWPGNIRELRHVLERAVLLGQQPIITAEELHLNTNRSQVAATSSITLQPLEDMEQQLIKQALAMYENNISEAAKILGISRNALYRRLEKFGINHDQ